MSFDNALQLKSALPSSCTLSAQCHGRGLPLQSDKAQLSLGPGSAIFALGPCLRNTALQFGPPSDALADDHT